MAVVLRVPLVNVGISLLENTQPIVVLLHSRIIFSIFHDVHLKLLFGDAINVSRFIVKIFHVAESGDSSGEEETACNNSSNLLLFGFHWENN